MLVDYHWHTIRCGHATGTMQEYVNQARRLGIKEVGFSDHVPMYWLKPEQADKETAMGIRELPCYIRDVQEIQKNNPDMSIKLGLEVDYIPGQEKKIKEIIDSLPLDYVLGSIHFIDQWGFDNPAEIEMYQKWDVWDLYQRYFQLVSQAASSGLFDIMAHTDLIKKFGYRPQKCLIPLYQTLAETFAKANVCIEVNTAGLRVPAKEFYPAKELLEQMHHYGVPVTLGSDAHQPGHIGKEFGMAIEMIKSVGYKQIAVFTCRNREFVNI